MSRALRYRFVENRADFGPATRFASEDIVFATENEPVIARRKPPAGSVRPELGNRLWTSLGVWELATEPTDDVRAALLVRSNSKRIC